MPREVTSNLPKGVVPSVLKAARLLDVVAASTDPLSLAQLCERLELPKSSTLSLCTSLTQSGLLRRFEDGAYHLGSHLVDLAHAYLARTDVAKEFNEAFDSLRLLHEEGAVLAIRDGTDVIYIACRNGSRPMGITYRVGMRLPASCTATGKAILSTLADDEVKALYKGLRLPHLTDKSLRSVAALLTDLREVRTRGYAIDDEETREGMRCVGAPICDGLGGPAIGAVAVSMLKGGANEKREEAVVDTLQQLSEKLLHRMKLLG